MKESGGWPKRIGGEIRKKEVKIKDVENKWTEKARVQSCVHAASKGYDKVLRMGVSERSRA